MPAKTCAVVQARMGASRLPNKMMLWLHGYPVVEWIYRRVCTSSHLNEVIFALPDTPQDDVLAEYLERLGARVYRGSESNVLGRFVGALIGSDADNVIRICADNPFISGSEIDRLIDFYSAGDFDYAYNHIPKYNNYPDGLGAEVVSIRLLRELDSVAQAPSQREHVLNYIWDNASKFRIGTCDPLEPGLAHPELKLDLDTTDDYKRLLSFDVSLEMSALEIINVVLKNK